MDAGAVVRGLLGAKGDLRRIRFREGDRSIEWQVPGDSIWVAVKDNLLLQEYERMGINLSSIRGTVIDAGANAGLFALRAAVHAQKVIALEPHPELHELLRLNIQRNAFHNVESLSEALWVGDGGMGLTEGAHSGESSVFGQHGRRFQVDSMTLDALITNVGRIELLKLDIEGAEFPILCEARPETLGQISKIVGELHLHDQAALLPRLVEHLHACGFDVSIRRSPICYWQESLRQTVGNWHHLEGLLTLKVMVLLIYSLAALGRAVSLPLPDDELRFVYAVRRPAP